MAYRLRDAPWWARAVLFGVPCGIYWSFLALSWHRSWMTAIVTAVIGGGVSGVVMGLSSARRRREERRRRTPGELAAIDSLSGGPLPTDSDLRALARRVGEHRLRATPRWTYACTALTALCLGLTALRSSPWFGGLGAMLFTSSIWSWRRRVALGRRVRQLRDDPPHPHAGEDALQSSTQPITPGTLDDMSTHTGSWSPPRRP